MTGKLTVLSSIMLNEYGFATAGSTDGMIVMPCSGKMTSSRTAIVIPVEKWEKIFEVFKSEYQLTNKHGRQKYIHKGSSTEFLKMIAKDTDRYPLISLKG